MMYVVPGNKMSSIWKWNFSHIAQLWLQPSVLIFYNPRSCRLSLDFRGSDRTANRKWIWLRDWEQWIIKISAKEEEKSVGGKRGLIYCSADTEFIKSTSPMSSQSMNGDECLAKWQGFEWLHKSAAWVTPFWKETRGRHFKLVMGGGGGHKDINGTQ